MNNPPMLPSDFTAAQRERPALVNDDARNFFNGVFTEAFIFYRVAYRNSDDATAPDSTDGGVVIPDPLDEASFVAPTFETFETVQSKAIEVLQNFREPDLNNVRLGRYTIFDEELTEALLTWDFRDALDAIALSIDANLTADPYYWDFLVRQPQSGATPQWADVFIGLEYDTDGTALIKVEKYQTTVPPGNLSESENVIDADRGGDAFEKILLEGNTDQLNFDGSEYAGGTSADEGKRKTTVETPPGPICPLGLTYNPDSGLCADADDFETSEPTCPEGYRWDVTSRACVLVG